MNPPESSKAHELYIGALDLSKYIDKVLKPYPVETEVWLRGMAIEDIQNLICLWRSIEYQHPRIYFSSFPLTGVGSYNIPFHAYLRVSEGVDSIHFRFTYAFMGLSHFLELNCNPLKRTAKNLYGYGGAFKDWGNFSRGICLDRKLKEQR